MSRCKSSPIFRLAECVEAMRPVAREVNASVGDLSLTGSGCDDDFRIVVRLTVAECRRIQELVAMHMPFAASALPARIEGSRV